MAFAQQPFRRGSLGDDPLRISQPNRLDVTMTRQLHLAILALIMICSGSIASAQITAPRSSSAQADRYDNLQDQLVNRLRATRDDQQAYIDYLIKLLRKGRLETKLVVAIERYAMRRNRDYPFPFFERALRYEASKRGVALPPVENFASTRNVSPGATRSSTKDEDKSRWTITIRP